ncbi:MAG: hypothetical protein QM706_11580 [Nitrospira sp.]
MPKSKPIPRHWNRKPTQWELRNVPVITRKSDLIDIMTDPAYRQSSLMRKVIAASIAKKNTPPRIRAEFRKRTNRNRLIARRRQRFSRLCNRKQQQPSTT